MQAAKGFKEKWDGSRLPCSVMESMRFSSKWEHGKHDGHVKFWTEIDANSFGVCTSMLGNFEDLQVYNCLMLEDERHWGTGQTSGTNISMRVGNIKQTNFSTKDGSSHSECYKQTTKLEKLTHTWAQQPAWWKSRVFEEKLSKHSQLFILFIARLFNWSICTYAYLGSY